MYTKIYLSNDKKTELRAIVQRSHYDLSKRKQRPDPNKPRTRSEFGSKAYRDALQRAFNKVKKQIYFNPDMQYFVTLTYAGLQTDHDTVIYDLKQLFKQERRKGNTELKYVYVLEWQKRGSLHVHLITNNKLTTHTNKNGYKSLTYWKHGFTSMLHISDFDNNFKPYLYLFKYMKKAERIGKSFVHTSRNLNNFHESTNPLNLMDWTTITQEYTYTKIRSNTGREKKLKFYRNYLVYDIMDWRTKLINEKKDYRKWQKLLLHSTRAKAKHQENHLQH